MSKRKIKNKNIDLICKALEDRTLDPKSLFLPITKFILNDLMKSKKKKRRTKGK